LEAKLVIGTAPRRSDRCAIGVVSVQRAFSVAFSDLPGWPFGESIFPPAVEDLLGDRRLDNLLTYRTVFIRDQLDDYEIMRASLQSLIATLR
jgi:hypothetical protein